MRPYVIIHILSALNGRISGPFMGSPAAMPALAAYGKIREEADSDAWLYGTSTAKEFTGFRKPKLQEASGQPDSALDAGDYRAPHSERFYFIAMDTKGKIGWESAAMKRGGRAAHVIVLITADTPGAYRNYLRKKGISYIQAGEHELDCGLALEKLSRLFGIRRLLVCGGGMADWTFLNQGAADELSLVLAPVADGTPGPSVFDAMGGRPDGFCAQFLLKKAEPLEGGALHLVYQVTGGET